MRQEWIGRSLLRRVGDRTNLILVLLVGSLFTCFRLAMASQAPSLLEILLPFAVLLLHVALGPIPWQWTGDDAPRAGFLRGMLQALLLHGAWVAVGMAILQGSSETFRPPPPPRPPPPMREEPRDPGRKQPFPGLERPRPPEAPPLPEGRPLPPLPPGEPRAPLLPASGFGLVNLGFAIFIGWALAEKEALEIQGRRTAELLRQAEARALQKQLEPHVLYNALGGLSELVYEDPLAAEEVLARLADLYRMLSAHTRKERVSLGEERALVEAHLAMEQMRLGERLQVSWAWPDWTDALRVPPLLLQPLVENAIKHGISPCDAGGALAIACAREGREVVLSVRNGGRPLDPERGRGIGLDNLAERLDLWRGARATFSLASAGGWTCATLRWTPEDRS